MSQRADAGALPEKRSSNGWLTVLVAIASRRLSKRWSSVLSVPAEALADVMEGGGLLRCGDVAAHGVEATVANRVWAVGLIVSGLISVAIISGLCGARI
jgi:hypothetical protein